MGVKTKLLACGVMLAVSQLGCGSEEGPQATGKLMGANAREAASKSAGSGNRPPKIQSLRLTPDSPRPGETVRAEVQSADSDGDTVTLAYQWYVDGSRTADKGPSMQVSGTSKGSQIEVRVVARDGKDESETHVATTYVGNRAPVLLGVVIEPLGEVTAQNDVVASPRATDADGDEIEYEFRWRVNGDPVSSEDGVLSKSEFARGDKIDLTVIASDGDDESEPLSSDSFEVVNAAPEITSVPGKFDDAGVFNYRVVARDPDGDRVLRYRLNEAPRGMRIDPVSGLTTWTPSESDTGSHRVVVEVSDQAGGKDTQTFDVQVAFADAPKTAAADVPGSEQDDAPEFEDDDTSDFDDDDASDFEDDETEPAAPAP